jgi:phospholipase/carboxylesterase
MVYDTRDAVVLLPRATASRDHFQLLGYAVQWHEYAMEHPLCQEEIQDIKDCLLRVLA